MQSRRLLLCFLAHGLGCWAWGDTPSATPYQVRRDVVYREVEGEKLLLDAYVPKSETPAPAVLVVHGGSWKTGNKSQLMGYAMRLAARGYATFAINYRLAPKHPHPAQIEDCRAAVRWIDENAREYKADMSRLGAIGYSAGAHLVFLLGVAGEQNSPMEPPSSEPALPRVRAVVAGGSPCNFTVIEADDRAIADFLGGTKRERPKAYVDASPFFYLSEDDPPILFFHGTRDTLVTIRGPEIMVDVLKEKGVEADLYRVEGGDHITSAMNLPAIEKSIEFLDSHLKTSESGLTQ